ncbi:hypothetical protein NP493_1026g00039 [Ridgeia piscesae]|uniref:Solute carrier family 35 member F5 n=1 Tax=Ridgeia piscesae TaxID=27915 RepID=A0AAD9KIH6_RIDPI|nr:hypothetical protein NP493_1026g00039 [Ridgeia piscesae]
MFGLNQLTKLQRLVLGVIILLIVDVIWVASTEVTRYLYTKTHFDKPYLTTYVKTSLFVCYLTGFIVWRSWCHQCGSSLLPDNGNSENKVVPEEELLSEPIYVPLKTEDKSSGLDSDDITSSLSHSRSVRFSNLSEVRQLSSIHAEDAALARLPYATYRRLQEAHSRVANRLTVKQIAKLAALFSALFFFGNLAYSKSQESDVGIVHMVASTSSIFTLILSAIFPSCNTDRLTLSKCVTVLTSVGGVVLVSISTNRLSEPNIAVGALWSLCGAILYALYLVLLRRRVDNEDKLNIPMFFGFLGLFTLLLLSPVMVILHVTETEVFEWPSQLQCIFLVANGLMGTVVSQLLWLWACFLTSSLVAMLSLTLTIPMTTIADIILKQDVSYDWTFYLGTIGVFLAFFVISLLAFYDTYDPVLIAFKKCIQCTCRRRHLLARYVTAGYNTMN